MIRISLLLLVVFFACATLALPSVGLGPLMCGGYYTESADSVTLVLVDGQRYDEPCQGNRQGCLGALGFMSGFVGSAVDTVRIGERQTLAFAVREKFSALPAEGADCPFHYNICGHRVCFKSVDD